MTHIVTVYDIFLCRYTLKNIHTGVDIRTVKCHPKCNLAEGVLSRGILSESYSPPSADMRPDARRVSGTLSARSGSVYHDERQPSSSSSSSW